MARSALDGKDEREASTPRIWTRAFGYPRVRQNSPFFSEAHPSPNRMLISQPAALARFLGVTMAVVSTVLACGTAIDMMRSIGDFSSPADPRSFVMLGGVLLFGEWLWSSEGGLDRLRRINRIVFAALFGGSLLVPGAVRFYLERVL